jgi:hypothetical protein
MYMPGNGQIEHHYGIPCSLAAELFYDVCRAAVMGGAFLLSLFSWHDSFDVSLFHVPHGT